MGFSFSGAAQASNGTCATLAGVAGDYLGPNSSSNQNQTPNATGDRMYVPVFVPATATFDRLSINVVTQAGTTGTARLGVYTGLTGRPTTVVLDAGTVSLIAGTGAKEATISQSLSAGLYFLAVQFEYTGTAPVIQGIGPSQVGDGGLYSAAGAGNNRNGLLQTGTSGALGTAVTMTLRSGAPFAWLRYA